MLNARVYFCTLRPDLAELGDLSTPLVRRQLEDGWGRLSEWPLDDYHCWFLDRAPGHRVVTARAQYWRRVDAVETLRERRIDVYT